MMWMRGVYAVSLALMLANRAMILYSNIQREKHYNKDRKRHRSHKCDCHLSSDEEELEP